MDYSYMFLPGNSEVFPLTSLMAMCVYVDVYDPTDCFVDVVAFS